MTKFLRKTLGILDDFAAYVATVAGIILSDAMSARQFSVSMEAGHLAFAALIAFLVVSKAEKTDGSPEAKAGKKKNFVRRMGEALGHGMMWQQISGFAMGIAQ